ncbi:hypothetical protein NEMIN01_2031 [Nematocida minor]|uniref:uncharacterized protein n=1 Tax=Nematocida minor TaxID=1912983 RepID=UPI00221EC639|nr:uncharacterized protein NEMIN01_2031 [Nematocida minor]KAI5192467.1 hypothetical protein NEMIN01_2031 [Nematocida minor]
MDYLSWLSKTPAVDEITGFEEYIRKEKEESLRIMKRRLKKGKTTDKHIAEDILGVANKLYVKGEFLSAIDKIKEALTYNSMFDSAYYLLGIIYEEQGESEKSFNAFLIAASIKRTDISLWKKLYEYKKSENDLDYQIYILKRIKKIKNTPETLNELLGIYRQQKNIEKIFEIKAEMIAEDGFPASFISELLGHIRVLKNKVKIVDLISKMLDKEKVFGTLADDFIVGYIDLLFVENRCHLLSQLRNSLEYCKREVVCTRSQIILFFGSIISEISSKCHACTNHPFCVCRDNATMDSSFNILIESNRKSDIISVPINTSVIADPIHLVLTGYFLDILIKMRKYKVALKLLLLIDKSSEIFLNKEVHASDSTEIRYAMIKEATNVKKRIALVYDKLKDYDKSIMQYKSILGYKDVSDSLQSSLEEVKMKISEIYKKTGNIDLALEYALQIQTETTQATAGIERNGLLFYKQIDCMRIRSLMYKAMHIYEKEKIMTETSVRKYFISSAQELIMFLLKNTFVFTKKKKKRKDTFENECVSAGQLISTKDFEGDFDLLHEINDLGNVFNQGSEDRPQMSKKVYHDVIASLLGGLSVQEWHDVLYKYIIALYYDKSYDIGILLLKKALTSHILRSSSDEYISLLWMLVRLSHVAKDLESLHFAITYIIRFYAVRESVDITSFYYLSYFLINQIPKFHKRSEYYKFQKNVQRNLRRKHHATGVKQLHILTILCFSYMPSFIYTDTAARLEKAVEKSVLQNVDTTLLGISRAVALSSLFLTHASSRKVVDRDRYIHKGIRILKNYSEHVKTNYDHVRNSVETSVKNENIVYTLKVDFLKQTTYSEDNYTEKLSLLLYNLGRAFHQYKLYGLAERYYLESLSYTRNKELLTLLQINASLLDKKIEVEIQSQNE